MQPMVDIPADTIAHQDDRLSTRWQLSIDAFRLGRHPLTPAANRGDPAPPNPARDVSPRRQPNHGS